MSWAPITGSNFQDASGNLLASGKVSFQATDNNGTPVPVLAASGGLIIGPASANITSGAVASGFQVSPTSGFLYTVTITDCNAGTSVTLTGVPVTTSGIDFDTFNPTPYVG
jgi:hypothetical protein